MTATIYSIATGKKMPQIAAKKRLYPRAEINGRKVLVTREFEDGTMLISYVAINYATMAPEFRRHTVAHASLITRRL